ncbi:ABC transporter ATP-binding protein [Alkalibacillus haloalkaliphilus]|uniref:ABC transporter ATP-binding protein n=1 Tax=Alkalibacillus haloalkaliphilus TaxID=94136 RepID=UPI002936AFA4|nr:ABC transporter ATP-binding protein [Alkalibacillus haloalkaliphilus]MDV2581765.1 ABC transporter ATP-binding protein [Alkalibacillus haloalkaliphilus]
MLLTVDIKEAKYNENQVVLSDIQFSIPAGSLVGLIGPNGAGKSSIIKSIIGVMPVFEGEVDYKEYSYIPERPIFYEGLTLWEHIEFLYSTLSVDEDAFFTDAEVLLEKLKLSSVVHDLPDSFSKGMQQKAMMVLAFLRKPSLYIIDEPFMGLDPQAINLFLLLINQEKERGAGVLLCTHALDTAEKICDDFVLLSNGKILVQGELRAVQKESRLVGGSLFDCFNILTERDAYGG